MTDTLIKPRDLDWHPQPLHADYRSSLLRSPQHKRLHYAPTQTELTGPVFGHNMLGENDHDMIINYAAAGETAMGPRIMVHGVLRDEDGRPRSNPAPTLGPTVVTIGGPRISTFRYSATALHNG